MKKTAATFAILLICLSSLLAGPHNDVSLFFGHQGGGLENREGLNWSYGINLGLSPRVEMSAWGESTLTPTFFGDGALGMGFSFALLGERTVETILWEELGLCQNRKDHWYAYQLWIKRAGHFLWINRHSNRKNLIENAFEERQIFVSRETQNQ